MRILKKELWPCRVVIGVDDTKTKIDEIEKWLGETMGAFKGKWNAVYLHNKTDFYFRDGRDALMFRLRWA